MSKLKSKLLSFFIPKHWPLSHLKALLPAIFLILTSSVALDQVSKRHMQATMIFQQDSGNVTMYQGRKDTVFEIGTRKLRPKPDENYLGLHFQYSRNTGAAFSMFATMPDHIRVPFFNAVSVVALILIFYLFAQSRAESWGMRLAMVLILGGALGNFLDRMLLGYVIDFIDVEWQIFGWRHDFAVFNVADIAINIGVLFFVIEIFREWALSVREAKAKELENT